MMLRKYSQNFTKNSKIESEKFESSEVEKDEYEENKNQLKVCGE